MSAADPCVRDPCAWASSNREIISPPEHPPVCCTQITITVPPSVDAKTAQRHDYPEAAWRHSYARRSGAERANARMKDPTTIDVARGWVPGDGLTPMTLFVACALVGRNLVVAHAFSTRRAGNWRARGVPTPPVGTPAAEGSQPPGRMTMTVRLPSLGTGLQQSPHDPPVYPVVVSLAVQCRLGPGAVADLVAAYRGGVPVDKLARSFSINRTTVLGHVRRHGIPKRNPQAGSPSTPGRRGRPGRPALRRGAVRGSTGRAVGGGNEHGTARAEGGRRRHAAAWATAT